MAGIDEWATFFSGNYQGWMRPPNGEWEDIIGLVKLAFTPASEDSLDVTIASLEFFSVWTGCLQLQNMVMKGPTGQGDTYFECEFQARGEADDVQAYFLGGIFEGPGGRLFELELTSAWRKRPPARPWD